MAMKDDYIALTQEAFNKLMEYSTTNPTGTTIGKQWKRHKGGDEWLMCEYIPHSDPNLVGISYKKIVIREAGLKPHEVVGKEEAMELWNKQRGI